MGSAATLAEHPPVRLPLPVPGGKGKVDRTGPGSRLRVRPGSRAVTPERVVAGHLVSCGVALAAVPVAARRQWPRTHDGCRGGRRGRARSRRARGAQRVSGGRLQTFVLPPVAEPLARGG